MDPTRSGAPGAQADPTSFELRPLAKIVYSSGDFTLNTALSALSLVYAQYFLVQVGDVRPVLAGLIPLIGRTIDAFFDPLMGRISDRTRWRSGRRRPWFLIGALPYGALFAAMWADAPCDGAAARFAWYAAVYTLMNLAMSVLTVPYVAIQPEMAIDYDARTSLNVYRTFGGTLGIFAAVTIEPIAEALGGGKQGFAQAGALFGVLLALPWLAVYRVTFERPEFRERRSEAGFREAVAQTFRHRAFVQLTGIYIMGRIAMDLAAALLILFMSYWIGRREDFTVVMALFLGAVVLALPAWLALARGRDKAHVFVAGSLLWMVMSAGLALFHPDSPRWAMFVYVPLVGIGFAVVDVMPWSMLGEVIDEDDLATGERREGLYNGMFAFLRKLGGAIGVFLVMACLDLFGYEKGHEQTDTAREAIRWMTALAPVPFLAAGIWLTRGYPLSRQRHSEILAQLSARAQRAAGERSS
jgi:sugar (glycoside-pentoside-hexuronide) transporter